ncbi:hypothetical protein GH714_019343 [Hevea brasiliensis]|uniref:Fungal lipase-type domain-containing protein n=1 Tax=Hevea brasiliensis TaxID=3981 RepID=A0A6A6MDT4_HEVBR|nr:hypothetical protein GH714_019343 [Hevea brasiliensis]
MRLSLGFALPSTLPSTSSSTHSTLRCCTLTQLINLNRKSIENQPLKKWERLLDPVDIEPIPSWFPAPARRPVKLGNRWMEYQGVRNWEGMLDPLDDNLREEILRYGHFVEAAYKSFDFDPSSPAYATCRFPKSTLLERSGLPETGYRLTKHLRATSGIQLPRWIEKRLAGRRDVVIAFRGTATCLEWLENLRATLGHLPNIDSDKSPKGHGPMVESGFWSLYTSGTTMGLSLQDMVREEIKRLLQSYGDEPLSLTITGHSLGAALAILSAYDIKTTFKCAPLVTVISFGGPRVGNRSFRQHLEKQGTKVLRIVNSDDLITKVPGFVIDGDNEVANNKDVNVLAFLAGSKNAWRRRS